MGLSGPCLLSIKPFRTGTKRRLKTLTRTALSVKDRLDGRK